MKFTMMTLQIAEREGTMMKNFTFAALIVIFALCFSQTDMTWAEGVTYIDEDGVEQTRLSAVLIERYQMQQHPEGGFFASTYQSSGFVPRTALPAEFTGDRYFSNAIVYLLKENDFSALHRLKQDEIWHFYLGGALRLVMISPDGKFSETILGQNIEAGDVVQAIVPAGYWFGAKPTEGAVFSFVGCTLAPGFDFADFELAKRSELLLQFPDLEAIILEFTR